MNRVSFAISYAITRQHRGGIDVKGEEGKGTTFELVFPALKEVGVIKDA